MNMSCKALSGLQSIMRLGVVGAVMEDSTTDAVKEIIGVIR